MGVSSDWNLLGTIKAVGVATDNFVQTIPSSNPACFNLAGLREDGYRGCQLMFLGNTASQAYASITISSGIRVPGETQIVLNKLGTIGVTTSASSNATLASALGITTGTWYPAGTISTVWSPTNYTLNSLENVSGIATRANAPASSDIPSVYLDIPYLDGAHYMVVETGSTSSAVHLAIAIRGISRG